MVYCGCLENSWVRAPGVRIPLLPLSLSSRVRMIPHYALGELQPFFALCIDSAVNVKALYENRQNAFALAILSAMHLVLL